MALTIATGFVVDDAIVMMKMSPAYRNRVIRPWKQPSKLGAEFAFDDPVSDHLLNVAVVCSSVLFMGDVVGRLFANSPLPGCTFYLAVARHPDAMLCARLLSIRRKNSRAGSFGHPTGL